MGETCQFPPDHPIQNLMAEQVVPVQTVIQYHRYIYDRTFGSCSGWVNSLTFCYKPGSTDNLMTIEIRSPESGNNPSPTYDVTVNNQNDLHNCVKRYTLDSQYCCVEQMVTPPFSVQSSKHYALNIDQTNSLLLHHQNDTVSGMQEQTHSSSSSSSLPGPVYKPLFYFTIDTTNGRLYNYIHIWYNTPTSLSGPCMAATTPDTDDPTEVSNEDPTEGPTEGSATESTFKTNSPTNGDDPTSTPSTTSSSPPSTTPSSPADSTTASTDPEVADGRGGEGGSGPVAGGIAALLAIIILLIIGAVVGIMCLKKRQRQRKVVVSHSGEERAGIMNMVYGGMFYVR